MTDTRQTGPEKGESVRMRWRPERGDVRHALAAYPPARRRRRRALLLVACVLALALLVATLGPALGIADAQGLLLEVTVVLALLAGLMALLPWVTALRAWRGGYGRLAKRYEATISDHGVSISSEHSRTEHGWPAIAAAYETRHAFLLGLTAGRVGPVIVLPKRGLVGARPDDLRELLRRRLGDAAHLGTQRLGG